MRGCATKLHSRALGIRSRWCRVKIGKWSSNTYLHAQFHYHHSSLRVPLHPSSSPQIAAVWKGCRNAFLKRRRVNRFFQNQRRSASTRPGPERGMQRTSERAIRQCAAKGNVYFNYCASPWIAEKGVKWRSFHARLHLIFLAREVMMRNTWTIHFKTAKAANIPMMMTVRRWWLWNLTGDKASMPLNELERITWGCCGVSVGLRLLVSSYALHFNLSRGLSRDLYCIIHFDLHCGRWTHIMV